MSLNKTNNYNKQFTTNCLIKKDLKQSNKVIGYICYIYKIKYKENKNTLNIYENAMVSFH